MWASVWGQRLCWGQETQEGLASLPARPEQGALGHCPRTQWPRLLGGGGAGPICTPPVCPAGILRVGTCPRTTGPTGQEQAGWDAGVGRTGDAAEPPGQLGRSAHPQARAVAPEAEVWTLTKRLRALGFASLLPADDLPHPPRLPPCKAPSPLPGAWPPAHPLRTGPVVGPLGQLTTHPGEANAADGPTQHVCEQGRVRQGRGEVGEEVRAVPVCHLWGRRAVSGEARGAGPTAWPGGAAPSSASLLDGSRLRPHLSGLASCHSETALQK